MKTPRENQPNARDLVLREALEFYHGIEADYIQTLEATGVAFSPYDATRDETSDLVRRLRAVGARVRNGGASVARGLLSRGCEACTGACVSRTFALTNNCHRDCFFCFNPNQERFAYYCEHAFPWRAQLEDLAREVVPPACIALSGGEPLLMFDEACSFFSCARELFPDAHLRLYTAGDLLDQEKLERLRQAGLQEIRFSVKQDDPASVQEAVFSIMALALRTIPAVMVEMPPIPGTEEQMREILFRLDALGVHGINLLEFAYPMWNWPVFESLGLALRNPPYRVFYEYSYAGSLPVQGSEELCLRLMLWAYEQGLGLNIHYCSLENKHRAEMRNMNESYAGLDACYAFDYGDFFMKTAQVFGSDRSRVRETLRALGCEDFLEDDRAESTSFHPKWLEAASHVQGADGMPVQPCISTNVVVERSGGFAFRELKLELAKETALLELDDITARSDAAFGCLPSGAL